jgi:hypothetical protein
LTPALFGPIFVAIRYGGTMFHCRIWLMAEALRCLLFPIIVVAAMRLSASRPELCRKYARAVAVVLLAFSCVQVATGILRSGRNDAIGELHRWNGHIFLIAAWLFAPFAIGVLWQQKFRRRPGLAIAQSLLLMMVVAAVLLASFTGYLGPSYTNMLAEETRHRFRVLHFYVFPGAMAVLLLGWWWFLRRPQDSETSL